jgi:hypothetical protein
VPPTDLSVSAAFTNGIDLSWTPILYTGDSGYYEVSYTENVTGTYTVLGTTSAKTVDGYSVSGLVPGTVYFFRVRTFTPEHGYQQNNLWSEYTQTISGTITVPGKLETVTTILSDTPDPSQVDQPIYLSFEVTAGSGIPTGTVTVTVAGESAGCLGSLEAGWGACELTIQNPGTYTLTATYSGDENFLSSNAAEEHNVEQGPESHVFKLLLPLVIR